MIDYWSKLKIDECWSQKERFNIMMNYIKEGVEDTIQEEEVKLGKISVSITNEENEGIGNAQVTVSKGQNEYVGTTGDAGGCTIKDVPYDTYNVIVIAEGYVDGEDTITVDSDSVDLNMTLLEEVGVDVETPPPLVDEGDF